MENYEKCMKDNELLCALEEQDEDLNAILRANDTGMDGGEEIVNGWSV